MRTAFKYIDRVFLSEIDLLAIEGVGPNEADIIELPSKPPEALFVVDDEGLTRVFTDLKKACGVARNMCLIDGQMAPTIMVIVLDPSGRMYGTPRRPERD